MHHPKLIRNAVGLAAIGAMLAASVLVWRSDPDLATELARRNIPPLPSTARLIKIEQGGFFSNWLYAVVSIAPKDLAAYETRLAKESTRSFSLDAASPEVRILSATSSDDADRNTKTEYVDKSDRPWWNVDLIRDGTFYETELPDACRYRVYTDRERSIVYILWTRS